MSCILPQKLVLTPTNFAYGYAKRCLAVQINAYNKRNKTRLFNNKR